MVYHGKHSYESKPLTFNDKLQLLDGEEFRVVDNFPDYYISNLGRVVSCRTNISKILVQRKHQGYCSVQLAHPGGTSLGVKPKEWKVHRLVAFMFIGQPPDGKTDCCHKDGDGMNNHLDNLRWDSSMKNQHDKTAHGTQSFDNRKGSTNSEEHRRRISEGQKRRWAKKKLAQAQQQS